MYPTVPQRLVCRIFFPFFWQALHKILKWLFINPDEFKYWSKPETGIQWKGWAPPKDQAKAVDIETTAYALLSLAINKDLEGGLPVLKWITSQRNPEGGFASTQVSLTVVLYSNALMHSNGIAGEILIINTKAYQI